MLNEYGEALCARFVEVDQAPVPVGVRVRYERVLLVFASPVYGAVTAMAVQTDGDAAAVTVPAIVL